MKRERLVLIRDFFNDLNDVKSKIRILRRVSRVRATQVSKKLVEFSELENDLRALQEGT